MLARFESALTICSYHKNGEPADMPTASIVYSSVVLGGLPRPGFCEA